MARLQVKLAVFLMLCTMQTASASYLVEPLGIAGQATSAGALNEHGDVVVFTRGSDVIGNEQEGYDLAFPGAVWKIDAKGEAVRLPGLGGPQDRVYDLNDSGLAVGFSSRTFLTSPNQSVIWNHDTAMAIPAPANSIGLPQALKVNNSGQMVITSDFNGRRSSFLYSEKEGYTPLPMLEGMSTFAADISEKSSVVGGYSTASPNSPYVSRSFLWENGVTTDLGGLGGSKSFATAINSFGLVVGSSTNESETSQHTYLWDANSGMKDLGTLLGLASVPIDVNDFGVVIGKLVTNRDMAVSIPYIYDESNGMRLLEDLLSPDMGLAGSFEVVGINNRGQILGTALFDGTSQAFLLSPVPEPSSIGLLFVGIAAMVQRPLRNRISSRVGAEMADGYDASA